MENRSSIDDCEAGGEGSGDLVAGLSENANTPEQRAGRSTIIEARLHDGRHLTAAVSFSGIHQFLPIRDDPEGHNPVSGTYHRFDSILRSGCR
jgi:hypothetical protein